MNTAPTYVLDRTLCARCGNEGTLKHEGILDGCPDCPRGREVRQQLAELKTGQADWQPPYGYCIAHGNERNEDGTCEYCEAER